MALCHFLFECALVMNLIVTIVYWGAIHAVVSVGVEGWQLYHLYYIHSTPFIAFIINFLITDIKI